VNENYGILREDIKTFDMRCIITKLKSYNFKVNIVVFEKRRTVADVVPMSVFIKLNNTKKM
jgi:hypothetical protein